jgi:hypothetical protein
MIREGMDADLREFAGRARVQRRGGPDLPITCTIVGGRVEAYSAPR